MSYQGTKYEPLYKRGYHIAVAAVIAVVVILQPFAKPPPANSKAFGCYMADPAPAIRLDRYGMSILQKSLQRFGFHLERHKTAVTLTADAPIRADLVNGIYLYSIYRPGVGTFLDFQRVENGLRYGQFDENHISMFKMLASNGVELIYIRTSLNTCKGD